MRFEYKTFITANDELQERLGMYGSEGWRLHTCDPVIIDGGIFHSVVMDKQHVINEEVEPTEPMRMKG